MIALLPILNALFGSLIKPFVAAWINYERDKFATTERGFEAAASSDAAVMSQALKSDIELNALKVQVYGQPVNRLIMLIAGVPPAVHFGLVFLDTILASKFIFGAPGPLGVPKLPAPYDTFEWAIVSSFFLVHAVALGAGNVSAWLNRKGA
ncbi:hypothetical protein Msil_3065 [Methylocella silvestris BL2]|uniref:Uncharacterized protein n=1 Tax=Methylocella silvestris (strain DSM 15510 / CIP 108128 / LMG 27833 / NCIMB 13906 / BL2) TaxID=395965 RepID=B8EKU7_METSB|nr:hypothetical protein [Methylocella silvestris]ACK51975.1 hypothetical protein Msil_3065 [Methylocella silvestris BL2]